MPPFERILFPTDLSDASLDAVDVAVEMARPPAELTLLHVLPLEPDTPWDVPPYADFGLSVLPSAEFRHRLQAETRRRLEALAAFRAAETRTRVEVRTGDPAPEILAAVREGNHDLIVMATHGWTGWRHLVLGSVAERVARESACPVLIVRSRERRTHP